MRISKVEFYGHGHGNFIRYAVIVVDGGIVVRGVKLIQRPDSTIMVAMPTRKKLDESYEEICHPVNAEAREIIERAVLAAWAKFPRVSVDK